MDTFITVAKWVLFLVIFAMIAALLSSLVTWILGLLGSVMPVMVTETLELIGKYLPFHPAAFQGAAAGITLVLTVWVSVPIFRFLIQSGVNNA